MICVIPSVASKWFELGAVLLDPKYQNELSTIEADSKNDATTCCRKMLIKWLNTDELASWDKLIKALKTNQLNDIASNIGQLLLQGEYITMELVSHKLPDPFLQGAYRLEIISARSERVW